MKNSIAILSLAFCASCSQTATVDLEAEMASLRQTSDEYYQSATSLNIESWASYYAPDATVLAPNSPPASGADEIKKLGDDFSSLENFTPSFEFVDISLSSDATMGYTLYNSNVTFTVNGEQVTDVGPDFHVWKKQADGSWKIVIDIWNSNQPMAMPDTGTEIDSAASE